MSVFKRISSNSSFHSHTLSLSLSHFFLSHPLSCFHSYTNARTYSFRISTFSASYYSLTHFFSLSLFLKDTLCLLSIPLYSSYSFSHTVDYFSLSFLDVHSGRVFYKNDQTSDDKQRLKASVQIRTNQSCVSVVGSLRYQRSAVRIPSYLPIALHKRQNEGKKLGQDRLVLQKGHHCVEFFNTFKCNDKFYPVLMLLCYCFMQRPNTIFVCTLAPFN